MTEDLTTYSRTRLEGALAAEQGDDATPQTERGRAILAELARRDQIESDS